MANAAAAKAMGVHIAIETNGFLGERLSDADLDQILSATALGIRTNRGASSLADAKAKLYSMTAQPPPGRGVPSRSARHFNAA